MKDHSPNPSAPPRSGWILETSQTSSSARRSGASAGLGSPLSPPESAPEPPTPFCVPSAPCGTHSISLWNLTSSALLGSHSGPLTPDHSRLFLPQGPGIDSSSSLDVLHLCFLHSQFLLFARVSRLSAPRALPDRPIGGSAPHPKPPSVLPPALPSLHS